MRPPPLEAGVTQSPAPVDSFPLLTRRVANLFVPLTPIFIASCGASSAPRQPSTSQGSERPSNNTLQASQAGGEPTPQAGMFRFVDGPVHIELPLPPKTISFVAQKMEGADAALHGAIGDMFMVFTTDIPGSKSIKIYTSVEDAKGMNTKQYGEAISREVPKLFPPKPWMTNPSDAPNARMFKGEKVHHLYSYSAPDDQMDALFFVRDGRGIRLVAHYDTSTLNAQQHIDKAFGSVTFDFTKSYTQAQVKTQPTATAGRQEQASPLVYERVSNSAYEVYTPKGTTSKKTSFSSSDDRFIIFAPTVDQFTTPAVRNLTSDIFIANSLVGGHGTPRDAAEYFATQVKNSDEYRKTFAGFVQKEAKSYRIGDKDGYYVSFASGSKLLATGIVISNGRTWKVIGLLPITSGFQPNDEFTTALRTFKPLA